MADSPPSLTAVPVFDEAHFAKAEAIESSLTLARQLPAADAARCAALAKSMLAKRNVITELGDPFSEKSAAITRQAYLPETAWEGLFKRWMQVAPQAAWEFVLAHHSDDLPLRVAALRQWALRDPAAAVKAAGKDISEFEQRVILSACKDSDPACGLSLMAKWGMDLSCRLASQPTENSSILQNLLIQLAKKSPAAALEWCQTNAPDGISSVCIGWNLSDPAGCLKWIKSRPREEQENMLETLCEQPEVSAIILRHFATVCEKEDVQSSLQTGFEKIAVRDESLSQSLIDELLPNPADRMNARAAIGSVLVDADPRMAMRFIMPSLRESLPLFELPLHQYGSFVPMPFGGNPGNDYSSMADVLSSYISLGPAAGIGKAELLDTLRQIHPQYISWMLQANADELTESMGTPGQWLQPFVKDLTREDVSDILENYSYQSPEEALLDVKSLTPGLLRDGIIEKYSIILLEKDTPVAEVMDRISSLGSNHADLGELYHYWMDNNPAAAMKHFSDNSEATFNEWFSVIRKGFKDHSEQIQDMAEALPPGPLRSDVAQALAENSLDDHSDYLTSMYWATEITSREERKQQILKILESKTLAEANEDIFNGVRSYIEQSSLGETEKAYWLDRMESEVGR
jgi:hypothetical protein